MARKPAKIPEGADPRLDIDADELDAATRQALPSVAKTGGMSDAMGLAFGFIGVAAIGAFTIISLNGQRMQAPPPAPPSGPPQVEQNSNLPPINPGLQTIPDVNAPIIQPVPPQPQPVQGAQASQAAPVIAPALVVDNSGAAQPASGAQASAAPTQMLNPNDAFAIRMGMDVTQKAWKIGDPAKIVPQGTVIPAVLETAINSDLPGYTRAIVSRDVRSFDGTTVLIPRGSRLIGQYKSGLVSGETRVFIIWNRLIRPDGLSVQLASPVTDDLGQAGTAGKVDNHYAKRFGSAALLSVVNGIAAGLSKSSNTIVIGTSRDAQNIASEALTADARIPPTIKVPQGTSIQVFAARDLDFNQ